MYHKDKSIGLMLGSGLLTKTLIDKCKKKKIKFYIISVDNNFDIKFGKPDLIINFNNIGNIFKFLKKKKINQVIFLGKVQKKALFKFRPNLITFYYLVKLIFFYNKGDGKLINKILNIFIINNINIIDPRVLLKENLCDKKNNNISEFNKNLTSKKIKEYFLLAKKFGERDKGQAVIVSDNKVILSEDRNGTDYLIKKFKTLNIRTSSYLIKVSKPGQDLRIDLPTIGPTTIQNIVKAGLQGLIVENKKTFVENPTLTFKIIKEKKLFFYVF